MLTHNPWKSVSFKTENITSQKIYGMYLLTKVHLSPKVLRIEILVSQSNADKKQRDLYSANQLQSWNPCCHEIL